MKANPGGQLAPEDVVGRDGLIAQLWDVLERLSMVLTAERRIGKTQLIKKMQAEAADDVLALYRDLEGVRTPLEFVELVFADVEDYLSRRGRVAGRVRKLFKHLAGSEIGEVVKFPESLAPHWKELLEKTVEDLIEHQDRQVIFFWDEVPLMLYNVRNRAGEEAAMEVLDVLRELRQTHASLRMVFTGSIGLHNVITALQAEGYANEPTNDMKTVNVPPLSPPDAEVLARRLLDGEAIQVGDPEATGRAIAERVDYVPFYIHHVVYDLKYYAGEIGPAAVEDLVLRRLTDSQDEWRMEHYRRRLNTYYTPGQQQFALALLDALAADEPLAFGDLFDRVKARNTITDDKGEAVRDVLKLLHRDHYVELDADGVYRFRFPLIRRWWQLHRG